MSTQTPKTDLDDAAAPAADQDAPGASEASSTHEDQAQHDDVARDEGQSPSSPEAANPAAQAWPDAAASTADDAQDAAAPSSDPAQHPAQDEAPDPAQDAQDAQATQETTAQAGPKPWDRQAWMGLGVVVLVGLVLLLGMQSRVGFWEPWEAHELLMAREYLQRSPSDPTALQGHTWAVPTAQGKPVAASLLKVWLLALSLPERMEELGAMLGALELRARAPFALIMTLTGAMTFVWTRRTWGTLAALCSGVALVTMPAVALGVHNLATPTLFMATTALAVMAAAQLADARAARARGGYAALMGLGLILGFLDQRLLGALLPLEALLLTALTQLDPERSPTRAQRLGAAAVVGATLAGFGLWLGLQDEPWIKAAARPHVGQLATLAAHLSLSLAALMLAWRTPLIQALRGWPALGALGALALVMAPTLWSYSSVNPTLLDQGRVVGKIPALSFLLENHLFERSFAKEHVHFDLWIRQVGFGAFPWIALAPGALGYLMRAPSWRAEDQPAQARWRERLLLCWIGVSLAGVALGSAYGHAFAPVYVPLAIASGVMLSDAAFWRALRRQPLLAYAIGLMAIAAIMTLGKDIERYPNRFIELYMSFEKELKLPEGFSYSRLHKPLKYGLALGMVASCFGVVSWAGLWWQRRSSLRREALALMALPSPDQAPEQTPPLIAQALQKEALREQGQGLWGRAARAVEGQPGMALWMTALLGGAGALFVFAYQPAALDHLSQRHLFESYHRSAGPQGSPLYRYQTPDTSASIYLSGLPALTDSQALISRVEAPERLYAVIPRERLAAVNAEVRERLGRNIHVLNARSSRLVLLSDQLGPGEQDQNHVARAIIPPEALPQAMQHEVKVEDDQGQRVHPSLDGQLEFLGYSLDRPAGPDGVTVYKWGDTLELSLFFKVKARVPGAKKVFVHIDTQGNRIHGDHDPVGGELPTTTWLPQDIIKDTHKIAVESYSTRGVYTIFMGLYQGNDRMKISPRKAHDGVDRIAVGKIRVQ